MRTKLPAVLICTGVTVVLGSGYAVADTIITGKKVKNGSLSGADVKNGSLTTKDLKKGTIKLDRLSKGAQAAIRKGGPQGPAGTPGATGAPGSGSIGGAGINGASGNTTKVASLGTYSESPSVTAWTSRANTCDQTPGAPVGPLSLTDTIKFGAYPDGSAASGVASNRYAGKKVKDVAYVAYTAKYDQTGTDFGGGTPYFRIYSHGAGEDPFTNATIYSPNTQPDAPSSGRIKSGVWSKFTVSSGTVRFNDDAGDDPSSDVSFDKYKKDHGDEVIDQIRIQGGCSGSYSDKATGFADNLSVDIAGKKEQFDFGS